MHEPPARSVEERLRSLEAAVQELRETVPPPAPPHAPRTRPAERTPHEPSAVPPAAPGVLTALLERGPQFWISRVGIGLLLVGVAYLFKYAVDEGWLTPAIRVGFGLALGATLAAIGFRVEHRQRWYGQIMLGGAAATWYITGFAAFQVLHVVSHAVAFSFMVLVTLFTFWVSVRQDEAVLSGLAAVAGLGTPFFLYAGTGSVPGLVGYTSLLLAGTSAIYLFRGWRSLLWTTAVGGWLVLALGFQTDTFGNRLALQTGIIVLWLLFWLVPLSREVLVAARPSRWRPTPEPSKGFGDLARLWRMQHDVAALVLATAVAAVFTSRAVWTTADSLWEMCGLLLAVPLYGLTAWRLSRRQGLAILVSAHRVTAAVLTALAIALLTHGHAQLFLWAALAVTLHVLAQRLHEPAVGVLAHVLFAVVAFWLLRRITQEGFPATPIANVRALADAGVIAAGLAASWWIGRDAARWYRLAAHAAVLGWLWRELTPLPAGEGIVTAAWGVYGLGLLLGLRQARNVGLGTLFLAAAKLVVFDLSQVEPLWRILLSLGFGGVFLAISYRFRSLWAPSPAEGDLRPERPVK